MKEEYKISIKFILGIIGAISTIILIIQGVINIYDRLHKEYVSLGYSVQIAKVIENETIMRPNPKETFYAVKTNPIFEDLAWLWIYKIEIKNTGTKDIKYSDFYEKEKLKINMSQYYLYGAYIDNKTKPYIAAEINPIEKNDIYIKFDTIEPNDSIFVSILASNKHHNIRLSAKTKEFDTILPMDYETAKLFYDDYEIAAKLRPKNFYDYLYFIMQSVLIGFLIYYIFVTIKTRSENKHNDK